MLTDLPGILRNNKLCDSAILFSDMFGNEKLLFVLPDEVESDLLSGLIPQLVFALERPVTPIFLRHRELLHLQMPPDIGHSTFHVVDDLLDRGTVLFGADLRTEIPRPKWASTRFRYQLEYSSELNRVRFLSHLITNQRIDSLIGEALHELMYSFLLVHGDKELGEKEVISRFMQVAGSDACESIDRFQSLIKQSASGHSGAQDRLNKEAVWIYESLVSALFSWIDSQEVEEGSRYQLRGAELVPTSTSWLSQHEGPSSKDERWNRSFTDHSTEVNSKYWSAVEAGVNELKKAKDIISILLHGSLARNQLANNRSDVMDGYVILDDGCMSDRTRFLTALDAMITSCRIMSDFGLPFHPFRFASMESFGCREQAEVLMDWSSDKFSRVLAGVDVRMFAGTSGAGRLYNRRTASLIPLHGRLLCCFIPLLQREAQQAQRALAALDHVGKHLAKWVCLTRDIWVRSPQSTDILAKLLPGLDLSVLFEIGEARERNMSTQDIRNLLAKSALLTDQISTEITGWLQQPEFSELVAI